MAILRVEHCYADWQRNFPRLWAFSPSTCQFKSPTFFTKAPISEIEWESFPAAPCIAWQELRGHSNNVISSSFCAIFLTRQLERPMNSSLHF